MKKVLVCVAICTLIVGSAIGGITLTVVVAAVAAGITGFFAWEIKTMQEKARENTRLLPQCEKNIQEINDKHKRAGALLERIKKESIRSAWEDLDARFICIDPLYINGILSEARALVHDMPLWFPRTNTLLVALEKATKNDLVVLEKIAKTYEAMERFKEEIVTLFSSIQEKIVMMETRLSLSEKETGQLALAKTKMTELKRIVSETREIDHTAIFMQLRSLSGTMERLAGKNPSTKENVLPFKIGRIHA